jgi:hypothetical protein
MRRSMVLVLAVWVAACGQITSIASPSAPQAQTSQASGTPPTTPAPSATPEPPSPSPFAFDRNPAPVVEGSTYEVTIEPASFVQDIDNPFLPFSAGAKFVFDGAEHVVVEVLPDRKVIISVSATVVRDRVFEDGALIEDTLDWYAQDRQGNVWYFGEQTAEYDNGKVTSTAGSWEAGVDGAQPGIVMLAVPEPGDVYRQEFYAGEAEDQAEIIATTGRISVEAGTWSGEDVLVTEEWTPLEPGVRERKTYARGVGVVEIRTVEGGDEVTTLTSATRATTIID